MLRYTTGMFRRVPQRQTPPFAALCLAILLLAFVFWSLSLLWQTHDLRGDLEQRLTWLEDIRRLRGELEQWQTKALGGTGGDGSSVTTIQRTSNPWAPLRQAADQSLAAMAEVELDDEWFFAIRDLQGALASVDEALAKDEARTQAGTWDAVQRFLAASASLEARLQHQVARQLRRLDDHWRHFDLLVGFAVVLAFVSLGLLRLSQTRRRELLEARREVRRQASHDALTGLWNRETTLKLLRDQLARAGRDEEPVGVVLIDVDHFKDLEVMLGEEQGNFILEQVGSRLEGMVRPYDVLGRLGLDSFLVILPTCDDKVTGMVARRLGEAVNGHDVEYARGRVRVSLSLAYAVVQDPAGLDSHLLVHRLEDGMRETRSEQDGQVRRVDLDP